MSVLRLTAQRLSASVDNSDDFTDALVDAAPEVNQWLAHCDPSPDCPVNPNSLATEAEQKAWQDAHTLKDSARHANAHHKKMISHQIRKRHRKNKDRINEAQADSLTNHILANAQTQTQQEIADALLESRQGR